MAAYEHRCISCGAVDEGPNSECVCMEPGEPCGICGEREFEPLTPWKSNCHWAEDGHEWVPENYNGPTCFMDGGVAVTLLRSFDGTKEYPICEYHDDELKRPPPRFRRVPVLGEEERS